MVNGLMIPRYMKNAKPSNANGSSTFQWRRNRPSADANGESPDSPRRACSSRFE